MQRFRATGCTEMSDKTKEINYTKLYQGRSLRITRDGVPLATSELARLIKTITIEQAMQIQQSPGECDGKCEPDFGIHRGPGVCVLKKYLKWGMVHDNCEMCRSEEIVRQLNWIFGRYHDAKYIAEWS